MNNFLLYLGKLKRDFLYKSISFAIREEDSIDFIFRDL